MSQGRRCLGAPSEPSPRNVPSCSPCAALFAIATPMLGCKAPPCSRGPPRSDFRRRCANLASPNPPSISAGARTSPRPRLIFAMSRERSMNSCDDADRLFGGMVLSALCGLWDSGFGAGLSPDRIVLVGARDLDPGERELIAAHGVRVIAAKDGIIDTGRVIEALDGAPFWLHIDTDVVDPLYLPAEYRVEGGLHPAALHALVRELVRASAL